MKARILILLLALALVTAPPVLAQASDLDGDGRIDHVLIGDWDGNGSLQDADIMAGLLALDDDEGVAELVAGVFELDPDNDGYGEDYGLSCDNNQPHVCIPRSGITLRGQGPGVTILRKGQKTPGADYGHRQLIGLAVDGTTARQSTTRMSNVTVRDLSLETVGTCDPLGTNAKALRFMDCDHCSVIEVSCKHANQSCVDFARCTFAESAFVTAEYVGNYDVDGAGLACIPGSDQPGLYLYTSDGFITEQTGHRDAELVHVGGFGVNIRSDGTETRPPPWGADDYSFNAVQRRIAQVVTTDAVYVPRYTGIAVPLRRAGPATGAITVEIRPAPGGVPGDEVVPGYAAADFTSHDAAALTDEYALVLFEHRLAQGYPERLAGGAQYAVVLSFADAALRPDVVQIQGDRESADDAFPGGDAATDNGAAWSARSKQDLNFSFFNGFHRDAVLSRITVEDVTGKNDKYGTCLNIAKTIGGRFSDIACRDAGVIEFGNNGVNIDSLLANFSAATLKLRGGGGWQKGLVMSAFGGKQTASSGLITNSPGSCVLVPSGGHNQHLTGLTLFHCGSNGVDIESEGKVVLNSSWIEAVEGDGVSIAAGAPVVTSNSFVDNGGCAIRSRSLSASAVRATGNVMLRNGTDGMCLLGSLQTAISWSSRDLPYVLESDLVVQAGGALTIDGATVVGGEGRRLIVYGSLDAEGATFTGTSASPAPGDWCGIAFYPNSSGSLRNVDVRYAGASCGLTGGGAAVHISSADVRIDGDSRISDSAGHGVYVSGAPSQVTIADSTIANNFATGVTISGAAPLFDGVQLIGNDVGASYVSGAGGWLTSSTIAANLTRGVVASSNSNPNLGRTTPLTDAERGLNNFICNPASVVKNGSQSLQARHNWWGAAPPPADTVGPVGRSPYLEAESEEVLRQLALATANGGADVRLCWEAAAPCKGYRVYRSVAPGSGFAPRAGHQTAPCFTDAGAGADAASYYYLVEVD